MVYRAVSLVGAALLAAGAAFLLIEVQDARTEPLFFGEMWLHQGVPSRLVVRPRPPKTEDSPHARLKIVERAGVDLLPYYAWKPPHLEDLQKVYEVVELPFSVTLGEITFEETAPTDPEIKISKDAGEQRISFAPGTAVVLGGESFVMREIRAWGGIISEPAESGGTSLAVVALRRDQGEWVEGIVAEHGDWLELGDDLVFRFLWVASEEAALQSLGQGVPGIESARWGVEEDGAVNWFDSFIIGTGIQLSDGTEVVLAEVREGGVPGGQGEAAIRFKVGREGNVKDVWVPANGATEDGSLCFSYPTRARFVVMGYSWQADTMLVVLFENGAEKSRWMLERGQVQALEAARWEFRLDQALESAVYLPQAGSPLEELRLESDTRILRLRQEEVVTAGDESVVFSPSVSEKVPIYVLNIGFPGGKKETLALHRESVLPVGRWSIQQAAGAETSGKWATLYLERAGIAPSKIWGIWGLIGGAAILVMANAVRFSARMLRKRAA